MKKQPTICWVLNVKATDDEAPLLAQALASISGYVDAIYLQLNAPKGQKISEKVRKVASQYADHVYDYEWKGNFVEARNHLFSQVPDKYDWVGWSDTDDTIENPEKIRDVLTITPDNVHGLSILYDYQHDDYGNVLVRHWVNRVVRNNGTFAWKSSLDDEEMAVHETLVPAQNEVGRVMNPDFKIIHHSNDERRERSLDRNIELLEGMYERLKTKQNPDPRILFYLATHYVDAYRFQEAKLLFAEYLQMSGWDEERSEAHVYMGKIALIERNPDRARIAFLMALGENFSNPHPLIELGEMEYKQSRYKQSRVVLELAQHIAKDVPKTSMVQRPGEYGFRLWMLLAQVYKELGGKNNKGESYLDKAKNAVNEALKLRPRDPNAFEVRDIVDGLIRYRDEIQAIINVVHKFEREKEEDKVLPFIASLPADMREALPVVNIHHHYAKPIKWPKKSIVMYVGPSALGLWGPWSLNDGGLGGSEEAVVRLSRELVRQGHSVTIYGTPGDRPGVYEGVEWKQYWEFNPKDEFDILVAWRNPWFFDNDIKARKRYLWMHDVMDKADFTPDRVANMDRVIFVSQYHADLFADVIPDEKRFASGNGIDPSEFEIEPTEHRDPHRMLYMSSHVRGLNVLLDIWPEIKKAVPDAKLDIYYGWESYDAINRENPERMLWKGKLVRTIEKSDGVTDHGRIPQDQIVKEIASSGILAYPCVTGDTLIDVPRDYTKYPLGVPIKELVGKKDLLAWSFNEETGRFELKLVNWVKQTRKKAKIIRVNWDDGTSIRLTPDHKVLTYRRGWVAAKDLERDESVIALKKHAQVSVSVGQGKWPYEHRVVAEQLYGAIPKGYHVDHEDGNPFNNDPSNLQVLSPAEHAKKTFTGIHRTPQLIARTKANLERYRQTPEGKAQLSEIGRKRSQGFWDSMTADERQAFIDRRNLARYNHKVVSIEDAGHEDVYDMEVQDNHNFIAGGVVVHNCTFPEVYCITLIKAMAGGAWPVTSDYGVLKDYNPWEAVHFDQYPTEEQLEKYKETLIRCLKYPVDNRSRQDMMRMTREQYSWERTAKGWIEDFKS